MGNLHPISLKLKKKQLWKSRIYQFKSTNLIESQNKQKISENLLNHTLGGAQSWQNHLISKPIFKESSSEVKILIYWWAPAGGSQGGKYSASRRPSRGGPQGVGASGGGVRKGRSGGFANRGGNAANIMASRSGPGGVRSPITNSMVPVLRLAQRGGQTNPVPVLRPLGGGGGRIEAVSAPASSVRPIQGQGGIVAGSAGMAPQLLRQVLPLRLVHQSAFAAMAHPSRAKNQGGQTMSGAKSNLYPPVLARGGGKRAGGPLGAGGRFAALYDSVRKLADNQMRLIFGKKVNIKLIRLRSPLLNSYLLAQFIRIQSTKRSLAFIWRKIKRKVAFGAGQFAPAGAASLFQPAGPATLGLASPFSSESHPGGGGHQGGKPAAVKGGSPMGWAWQGGNGPAFGTGNSAPALKFDWNNLVREGSTLAKGVNSYISGLKLQMSGRFTRRKGASRTTTQTYQIGGNFNFNSSSSLIDYAIIKTKAKNGSIGIKVYVSSRLQA